MNWQDLLQEENQKEYYKELCKFVNSEYRTGTVYPPKNEIFTALKLTPPERIKCVIVGQDPYHEDGQAMGLSFSVKDGVPVPASLKNIYKEINAEYGYPISKNGNLEPWARQGVLLLNSILTVRAHDAGSHRGCGWETYTDNIISICNSLDQPICFMLWGNFAKSKKELLNNPKHLVLESAHPSPYSAKNFLGNGHFKTCNEYLIKNNAEPINWQII